MSSKFFTWTKGDRSKNAPESLYSGGVVPIPVECIHIKGYDYPRTPKTGQRRPAPLQLGPSAEVTSPYDQPNDEQTTLQDAAVKSATSLIAVVNDMLRTPIASVRLPPPTSTLAPDLGRPRSRTAPSTPLVEAPAHPLAELPGSIPDRPRAAYHHSYDSKLGLSTRTYSHAKRPSHPWLQTPFDHRSSASTKEQSGFMPPGNVSDLSEPQHQHRRETPAVDTQRSSTTATTPRQVLHTAGQSLETRRHLHSSTHPDTSKLSGNENRAAFNNSDALNENDFQLSDASSLQASHEDHLAALTEAHQREVSSLRLYIAHLERRSRIARTHARPSAGLHTEPSRGDMHDQACSWRSPRQHHHEAMQNSMSLSQTSATFDTHCTASAGCGQIWLECNHLRNTLETTSARLVQSEHAVRRLQSSEASLVTTVENLRSQLSAAIMERLDVEETLYDAFSKARDSTQRVYLLRHELQQLRKCPSHPALGAPHHDGNVNGERVSKGHHHSKSDVATSPISSSSDSRSSPPLSPSRTPSPFPLGISIPHTPPTIPFANAQPALDAIKTHADHHPSITSPVGAHRILPLPASPILKPSAVSSRRSETAKSVGESIIELYSRPESEEWEAGWSSDGLDDGGQVRWVQWL